jgi:hypothetical protein
MAFGWPTRYWQLNVASVNGGPAAWDRAIYEASEEYKKHCVSLILSNFFLFFCMFSTTYSAIIAIHTLHWH